jgi:hypothetical protein
MYKLEPEYWPLIKTFLHYLDRLPETLGGVFDGVDIDDEVLALLEEI